MANCPDRTDTGGWHGVIVERLVGPLPGGRIVSLRHRNLRKKKRTKIVIDISFSLAGVRITYVMQQLNYNAIFSCNLFQIVKSFPNTPCHQRQSIQEKHRQITSLIDISIQDKRQRNHTDGNQASGSAGKEVPREVDPFPVWW